MPRIIFRNRGSWEEFVEKFFLAVLVHNVIGHNVIGHNVVGHNVIGHNVIGHNALS